MQWASGLLFLGCLDGSRPRFLHPAIPVETAVPFSMRIPRKIWMHISLFLVGAAYAARYYLFNAIGRSGDLQGVRVIVVTEHRVLLVSHWYAPGVWTLPGGGINRDETPQEAAIREVREETGLMVHSIAGEVGTYTGRLGQGDRLKVLYTEDFSGPLSAGPNLEIMRRSWFDLANLPDQLSPANRRRIEAYKAGVRGETANW